MNRSSSPGTTKAPTGCPSSGTRRVRRQPDVPGTGCSASCLQDRTSCLARPPTLGGAPGGRLVDVFRSDFNGANVPVWQTHARRREGSFTYHPFRPSLLPVASPFPPTTASRCESGISQARKLPVGRCRIGCSSGIHSDKSGCCVPTTGNSHLAGVIGANGSVVPSGWAWIANLMHPVCQSRDEDNW
jgi:hypothetical protein